jgi:hypothetical protein
LLDELAEMKLEPDERESCGAVLQTLSKGLMDKYSPSPESVPLPPGEDTDDDSGSPVVERVNSLFEDYGSDIPIDSTVESDEDDVVVLTKRDRIINPNAVEGAGERNYMQPVALEEVVRDFIDVNQKILEKVINVESPIRDIQVWAAEMRAQGRRTFDIIERLNGNLISKGELDAAIEVLGAQLFEENNSHSLNLLCVSNRLTEIGYKMNEVACMGVNFPLLQKGLML